MWISVPERVGYGSGKMWNFASYLTDSSGQQWYLPYVGRGNMVEVDDLFYDTDGRDQNDCVHAKLVAHGSNLPNEFWSNGKRFCREFSLFKTYNNRKVLYQWTATTGHTFKRAADVYQGARTITGYKFGYSGSIWRYLVYYEGSSLKTKIVMATVSGSGVGANGMKWEILSGGKIIRTFYDKPEFWGTSYNSAERTAHVELFMSYLRQFEVLVPEPTQTISTPSTESIIGYTLPERPDPSVFELGEWDAIVSGYPFMGPKAYWEGWLTQHAYLDALESAPTLNDNSISNIAEICKFISDLVIHRKISIPSRLQDLWLGYRYSYQTSKLDAEEAIKFMHRYADLGTLNRSLKCHGTSSTVVSGVPMTCRCRLDLKPKELATLEKIWSSLYTYGLQPNFYVVWDMIPYSFIVDWLIPVGDILHTLDAEAHYMGGNYGITNVVFSLSYDVVRDKSSYHCYSRWKSEPLRTLNNFYWFDKPKTSDRTKLFRILDAASLFIK